MELITKSDCLEIDRHILHFRTCTLYIVLLIIIIIIIIIIIVTLYSVLLIMISVTDTD